MDGESSVRILEGLENIDEMSSLVFEERHGIEEVEGQYMYRFEDRRRRVGVNPSEIGNFLLSHRLHCNERYPFLSYFSDRIRDDFVADVVFYEFMSGSIPPNRPVIDFCGGGLLVLSQYQL